MVWVFLLSPFCLKTLLYNTNPKWILRSELTRSGCYHTLEETIWYPEGKEDSPAFKSVGKYFLTLWFFVSPLAREDRECLSQNIANILARITPSFHQLISHSGQQPYSKFFLTFTALPPPSMKSSLFPTSGESHVLHKITMKDNNFLKDLIQFKKILSIILQKTTLLKLSL